MPSWAVKKWPKLLAAETRFRDLSTIYPYLTGAPIQSIDALKDDDDRCRLLFTAAALGVEFSPQELEYIYSVSGASQSTKTVRRHLSGLGRKLKKFFGKDDYKTWSMDTQDHLRELFGPNLRLEDIMDRVKDGAGHSDSILAQWNTKYPNIISSVLSSFSRRFLKGVSLPF